MEDIFSKYELLDPPSKQQVLDLLENLLSQQSIDKKWGKEDYKKKIASVSVWSEEDVRLFTENRKKMNSWQVEKW